MDSWYVISKGMDDKHKEHMLKLKKIYDDSHIEYKRQEETSKLLVTGVISELNTRRSELKDIENTIKEKQEALDKVKTDIVKADSALRMKMLETEAELRKIAQKQNNLEEDRARVNEINKKETDTIAIKKRELEILTRKAEEAKAAANEGCKKFLIEQENTKNLITTLKEKEATLTINGEDYTKMLKALDDKKEVIDELKLDLKQKEEAFIGKREALEKRERTLNKLDKDLKEVRETLDDKEISLNLKATELEKRENRLASLSEINKLNKK